MTEESSTATGSNSTTGGRLSLLVVSTSHSASHWLAKGRFVIGRAEGCEVLVDDESVSRRHLALEVTTQGLTLEELGSSNGSWLRGVRLEPGVKVAVAVGEPITMGKMLLVVQRQSLSSERRLCSHEYFEARVEEECLRAQRFQQNLAVLRVHAPRHQTTFVEQSLASTLRLVDIIGIYGPSEYEVLLPDTPRAGAELVIERLRQRLNTVESGFQLGLACYPEDSLHPHGLMDHAGRAIHSLSSALPSPLSGGLAMLALREIIERIAASDISVMVLGETGVGKERVSEELHQKSPRAGKPFLRLNCAALSESLLENELFGHEPGAFTGADKAKVGLLEFAAGGTVFLDEVAELPLTIQAKLLRVLEERTVLRVGGLTPRAIDVRFVCATNRDLEAEVARKAFREDLFFRLNGVLLIIPPLRERVDEIAPLTTQFIAEACTKANRPVARVSEAALMALKQYRWPGNIRELRNVVERAVLLCGDEITPAHLPAEKMHATFAARKTPLAEALADAPFKRPEPRKNDAQVRETAPTLPQPHDMRAGIATFEKEKILAALAESAGNQTRAAKLLGISRRALIDKLEKYDLPRPRKKSSQ